MPLNRLQIFLRRRHMTQVPYSIERHSGHANNPKCRPLPLTLGCPKKSITRISAVAAGKFGQLRLKLEVSNNHFKSLSSGFCEVYHPIMLLNEISPRISRNMFRYSSKLAASGGFLPKWSLGIFRRGFMDGVGIMQFQNIPSHSLIRSRVSGCHNAYTLAPNSRSVGS